MTEHDAGQDPPAAELMERAFDALAKRDLDGLATLWDDRTVDTIVVLDQDVVGEADLRAFFGEMFTAVPDLHFEVERILAVDHHTAVGQWHMTGTFSGGPFQGIEPTGREIDLRGVDVMTFEGGRLRHNDVYYDGLAFARQIGLLPPAGSRADRGMLAAFNARTKADRSVRGWLERRRSG